MKTAVVAPEDLARMEQTLAILAPLVPASGMENIRAITAAWRVGQLSTEGWHRLVQALIGYAEETESLRRAASELVAMRSRCAASGG